MYADTDFWLALLKNEDWLSERASDLLDEYRGDLSVSLATYIELFLIEERYAFDRDLAVTAIFELADYPGDEDVIYRASAYRDDGLNTFDAFHAALARDGLISSDQAFEGIDIEWVPLEPDS